MIEVSVINESPYELPEYQTLASAGVDLKAVLDEALKLKPLERKIIRTGLKIALPDGYEAQVRPRSGLAAKHGISILNAPGTIDADYRLIKFTTITYTSIQKEILMMMVLFIYIIIGNLEQTILHCGMTFGKP